MAKGSLNDTQTPEWSVWVDADRISTTPLTLHLTPTVAEQAAIAARLHAAALHDLRADVTLVQMAGSHLIHITGIISANVLQHCVVTLRPIETHIREEFEAWFADKAQAIPYARARQEIQRKTSNQQEVEVLDERDDPEPIINGKIDIGELVVQYLSLSLDPYPHAPDVDDNRPHSVTAGPETSPFAALAALKGKSE